MVVHELNEIFSLIGEGHYAVLTGAPIKMGSGASEGAEKMAQQNKNTRPDRVQALADIMEDVATYCRNYGFAMLAAVHDESDSNKIRVFTTRLRGSWPTQFDKAIEGLCYQSERINHHKLVDGQAVGSAPVRISNVPITLSRN